MYKGTKLLQWRDKHLPPAVVDRTSDSYIYWSSADVFPLLMSLLEFAPMRKMALQGLIRSVGGITKAVVRAMCAPEQIVP